MSKKQNIEVEILPIEEVVKDVNNPRFHPDENLELLQHSFEKHGAGRSTLIDENNTLIAGEGATTGAMRAGIKNVIVIDTDGQTMVAVRRKDLTQAQKDELKVLDNRTTETSGWKNDVLFEMLKDRSPESIEKDFGFNAEILENMLHSQHLESHNLEDFFQNKSGSDAGGDGESNGETYTLIFNFESDVTNRVLNGLLEFGKTKEEGLLSMLGIK
jgi:hypothetical protein